jgi:hypothetical protein
MISTSNAENSEFAKLYDDRGSDFSTNRFLAARHIMREWPDMPAPALSIFFSQWEGAGEYTDEKPKSGEYDDRQIAREWIKNRGLKKEYHSDGTAFDAVEEGVMKRPPISPTAVRKNVWMIGRRI